MTGLYIGAIALILLVALLWFARKAGKDAVRSKTSEKAIEQIVDATGPVSPSQRERLRTRYRRD